MTVMGRGGVEGGQKTQPVKIKNIKSKGIQKKKQKKKQLSSKIDSECILKLFAKKRDLTADQATCLQKGMVVRGGLVWRMAQASAWTKSWGAAREWIRMGLTVRDRMTSQAFFSLV